MSGLRMPCRIAGAKRSNPCFTGLGKDMNKQPFMSKLTFNSKTGKQGHPI
ncbi:MAG: hypothetical protein K6G27_00650 [Lachnospiraceae bacterium]|nr:hypothetical protein [Lachnospiraceae bacterium]